MTNQKKNLDILEFAKKDFSFVMSEYKCGVKTAIFITFLCKNPSYVKYKWYKCYRLLSEKQNKKKKRIVSFFLYRKLAKYSELLHCQMNCPTIGFGFYFEHGGIVINKNASIGQNFYCVGNNCVGSNDKGAPTIGDNVTLGYGAMIIGKVFVPDNTVVGAGAILTKSLTQTNCVVIGMNQILKAPPITGN